MPVRTAATGLRPTALSPGGPPPGAAQAGTVLPALALPLLAVGLSYPSILARLTTGAGPVAVACDPPV
ncbi:hypothetical protein ACFW5P_08480 [Streptomyces rochei]|uniref:hypothetical protein n=1 Tax=Streptomyces rochei TaxID=1928 RepID=UPI00369A803C